MENKQKIQIVLNKYHNLNLFSNANRIFLSDEIDKVLNSDEDPLSVIDTLKRPGTKPKFMTPTYSNENTKEEVSNNTSQEVKVLEKDEKPKTKKKPLMKLNREKTSTKNTKKKVTSSTRKKTPKSKGKK